MDGTTTIVARIKVPATHPEDVSAARTTIYAALLAAAEELRRLGMEPTEAIIVGVDEGA